VEAPRFSELSSAPRLPGLDLLRAVAISWVMLYHASLFGLASSDYWIVRFGWMGVDLFFALSGFLIAGQLLRPWSRGLRPNYSRFYARRALRTLPAYLVVVAFYFCLPAVRERSNIQPLWQFLTFTENLLIEPPLPKAFSQVWSLCVEEQFYLVFPAVVALLAIRPSAAKVSSLLLAILLGGMALRGYLWLRDVAGYPFGFATEPRSRPYMELIYYSTWTRLDGLSAGVAAACISVFRPRLWATLTARPIVLLSLGILGVGASMAFFRDIVAGFLPTALAFPLLSFSMALLVAAGAASRSIIPPIPGASALATGAYSLYLTHKAVFAAVANATTDAPAWLRSAELVVAWLAAFGVGAALYWLVERPFLRLRDRLEGPSRSSIAITRATAP
jgi:peptidoglycan/LPS O-acetylase OafA/YrhL